jgi:aminopeptidase N
MYRSGTFHLRLILAIATVFVAAILPVFTLAQEQQQLPSEQKQRHDCARSKAEHFARVEAAITAQSANQADFDVTFYDIDISIDPVGQTVTGTVTMRAEVVSLALTLAEIDLLDNMTVTGVYNSSGALAYTHSADRVNVTLDRTYNTGETFEVTIQYTGTPDAGTGAFGFNIVDGEHMIWSLSEAFGARSWWPCKDVPTDKADSVDIAVTVPSGLIVASNGNLAAVVPDASYDTYEWEERYPIATYLVSVAIHPYTTFSHWYFPSPTDSMEVQYYVFPGNYDAVQATYALTVPMIESFATQFGEYPFIDEKYGHAEFTWGGGMEHQTITSMGGWGEYLIAHELAHQWWGDMVTCDDFHHIWLNEGFATYSEALWSEDQYGMDRYHMDMTAAKYFGAGTIYVPDTSDWNRIFHGGLSYNKGSWVLHMLRHVVGDATFSSILQAYYSDVNHQYGTATTEEFRDLCEAVSGMDLDWFFHQWIYEEYFPEYSFEWSAAAAGGGSWDIALTVDQDQTNYFFKMPVDIEIQSATGDTSTVVVWDSLATQSFVINVPFEPAVLLLDPRQWILRTIFEPVAGASFDEGILVVNGVDFNTYGSEIWTAYEDSTFWGTYPMTFWDFFPETGSGYPANVPAPAGHGAVPSSVLGRYSTVVWVGNDYNGDLAGWFDTAILSYLEAGGNVLLLTRRGNYFLDTPLRDYLGITFTNINWEFENCLSTYTGLSDMAIIGTWAQSSGAVFDQVLTHGESTLLFEETVTFGTPRGLGVWREPAGGASWRDNGGQMVYISGRPYGYHHDHLRGNVEYILANFFGEPFDSPVDVATPPAGPAFALGQNVPNPFNPHTTIRFSVPDTRMVTLRVYDVAGRLVTTLAEQDFPAGAHTITWDGNDRRGVSSASGVYFYKIIAGGNTATRKMVLLR